MNFTLKILLAFISFSMLTGCKNPISEEITNIAIIPQPQELAINKGYFRVTEQTRIVVNSENQDIIDVANYFIDQFNNASGYAIEISPSADKKSIKNVIEFSDKNSDSIFGKEGYSIKSDKDRIKLSGTSHGLFYAVQTLFQLLPVEIYGAEKTKNIDWKIPAVEIKDKPRFKWRGMHLDVGRHLFPVSYIKNFIDYIAMHKLNTFHWHLTEDQGWRIEIEKYPRLTEIGSWRKGTQIDRTKKVDNKPYGGFYSKDEIREVVAYAKERFVTVVPEIELPGHSVAALAAYPELSCTGGPFEVRTLWGISDDIYCAGNDEVFDFLEDVLTEVMDLFPSEYIHIGGDEAPKKRWEACAKCQKRMKDEGLKNTDELQNYFISRIEKYLNAKGRKIIGWDEILEGGLAPNAAVMSWRGIEGGIKAAKMNHPVVMTPTDYLYFDYYQGQPENEPLAIGGFLPLEKVYSYEPVPEELNTAEQKNIIGVQANQWTEYIATTQMLDYMTFPRLCALSEIAWSPKEKKNLEDFLDRMNVHYARLDQLGINYRWPGIEGLKKTNVFIDQIEVAFKLRQKGSHIRFTMDGTKPSKNSTLYTKPFVIKEPTKIQLIEVTSKGKLGPVYTTEYIKQQPIPALSLKNTKKGVNFQYFEFSESIESVVDLSYMEVKSQGITEKLIFPFNNENLPKQFGLIFQGFINIPEDGVYVFSVLSNDGSKLYVGNQLIVDNDGPHGAYEKEGEIALKSGFHKIKLAYFQAGGGKALKVFVKNKKSEKIEIKAEQLSHE